MFALRSPALLAARAFSTSSSSLSPKVPVKLIAALRKSHPVPMAAAREALEKSNLDLDAAIAYLSSAGSASVQKKADKVSGRETNEGTIAVALLAGKRVSMVHLACETDFVARNDVFLNTARGVADTAAFLDVPSEAEPAAELAEFPVESLLAAPLVALPEGPDTPPPTADATTVKQALLSSLAQTGENLRLRRAVSFAAPFPARPDVRLVPGAYTHGGATTGKVGAVVVLSVKGTDTPIAAKIAGPEGDALDKDLLALARNLARQAVGFPTRALAPGDGVEEHEALLTQSAMMLGSDKPVSQVVAEWGKERGVDVEIVGMRRWSVEDEE